MNQNVGTVDRVIRIIVGIILLLLLVVLDGSIRYIGLIGIVPILTAIFKFCPLYTIFRINTNSTK